METRTRPTPCGQRVLPREGPRGQRRAARRRLPEQSGLIFPHSQVTELLTWRLSSTPQGGLDGLAPFLIDWSSTPHPTSRTLPAIPLLMMIGVHPDPAAVHKVYGRA